MKILGIDTSAKAASAAICDETQVLGEFVINTKLTHSQTIMPMVKALFDNAHLALEDMDILAVSNGPGSFTGLRIGIAAIKGMAMALNKPCVGVSTLEALAYNLRGFEGILCPVMDARCNQVYTATFRTENGVIVRLTEDRAIEIPELGSHLTQFSAPIFFVGDGADLCYNNLVGNLKNIFTAPDHVVNQSASSVCRLAFEMLKSSSGAVVDAVSLTPKYLRLPQAERELLKKQACSQEKKET